MAGAYSQLAMREQKRQDQDTYARLLAPQHMVHSHFKKHERIEGYHENRNKPAFIGSDRLLKIDSVYGRLQMGYSPQKGQAFLFANIKTSILDTAPSGYQRELRESSMYRQVKSGNQNQAYSARRGAGSAVLLYKMENKPWSYQSVLPYLRRVNMEALQKTMPFLEREGERQRIARYRGEKRELEQQLAALMAQGKYREMTQVRRAELDLSMDKDRANALLLRKERQGRYFFRRMNMAFDWQKHEMFRYYRDQIRRNKAKQAQTEEIANKGDEGDEDA